MSRKNDTNLTHVEMRLRQFYRFLNAIQELDTRCKSEGKKLEYYLIPLRRNDKRPETGGYSWKNQRKFCELSLDDAQYRVEDDRGNVGVVGTIDHENPNYTKDTIGLGILDLDVDENGNTLLPQRKIDELIRTLDTFTVRTRSGGYHFYFGASAELSRSFQRVYGTKNPHPRYHGIDIGEFRLLNQYVVSAGSYVPLDYKAQDKGHTSDATGYYEILIRRPIRIITRDDFPSWFECGTPSNRSDNKVQLTTLSNVDDVNLFVNSKGITLKQIREKDEELNRMLLGPGEFSNRALREKFFDRSRTDYYVVCRLQENGFSPEQALIILHQCRDYDKTKRDDYLEITVNKVYSKKNTPASSSLECV